MSDQLCPVMANGHLSAISRPFYCVMSNICLISPPAKVSKKSRLLKNKTDKMKNRSHRRTGCRNGKHVFGKLPAKFLKDCHNVLNVNDI